MKGKKKLLGKCDTTVLEIKESLPKVQTHFSTTVNKFQNLLCLSREVKNC
jgi:hypothetical protein